MCPSFFYIYVCIYIYLFIIYLYIYIYSFIYIYICIVCASKHMRFTFTENRDRVRTANIGLPHCPDHRARTLAIITPPYVPSHPCTVRRRASICNHVRVFTKCTELRVFIVQLAQNARRSRRFRPPSRAPGNKRTKGKRLGNGGEGEQMKRGSDRRRYRHYTELSSGELGACVVR